MGISEISQQLSEISQAVEQFRDKSADDLTENDYEEIKKIRDDYKQIHQKTADLRDEHWRKERLIQEIEEAKEVAPLVPIHDIEKELTEESFIELKREYEELEDFDFDDLFDDEKELEELIETIISRYEGKIKKKKNKKR